MALHLKVIGNLILIHRDLRGVASAYRGWLKGAVRVWNLQGELRRETV